jgi:hypothetical protein
VSDTPLQTASFDLTLLNLILGEAVETAAACVHLESSGDQSEQSVISWSVPVADLIGGSVETRLHIDDVSKDDATFRLLGLDSDVITVTLNSAPLNLVGVALFDTTIAVLKNIGGLPLGDIHFQFFAITVTVGFDGSIAATCAVEASNDSGDIQSAVESKLSSLIQQKGLTPTKVRQVLDSFFIQLMRLNPSATTTPTGYAQIQQYSVQNNSLVVTYDVTATAPTATKR